jgi:xanthine dehydrogenase accessory factor
MDDLKAVYEALANAQAAGESGVLATVVQVEGSVPRRAGSKLFLRADHTFAGTVGGGRMEALVLTEAHALLGGGEPRLVRYALNDIAAGDPGICGGTVHVFIEPVGAPPVLLVIGMGHVGRMLAELGVWSGFRVIACDDRADAWDPASVSGIDRFVVCDPADVAAHIAITPNTAIAAVTRGLPVDVRLIPALLNTPAGYIGLIGSRRRWALTARALVREYGVSAAALERLHAPIGLELGAETPKEIALSIMAEIVMVRRGGTGAPMRWPAEVPDEPEDAREPRSAVRIAARGEQAD